MHTLKFKGTVGPLKRAIFDSLRKAYQEECVIEYFQINTSKTGVIVTTDDYKLATVLPSMVFDRLPQYDEREITEHFEVIKL